MGQAVRVRMQAVEALMWELQQRDPRLRSDVVALAVLDRPPDETELLRRLAAVADAIPPLRSVVRSSLFALPTPELVVDPRFDPAQHVRRAVVPAPGGTAELLDLVGLLAEVPLDPELPRWELTVLRGLEGGRAAVALKIDHVLTDGARGMQLAASLLDSDDGTPPAAPRVTIPSTPERRCSALGSLFGAAGRLVRLPAVAAERAASGAVTMLRTTVDAPGRALDALRLADSIRRQGVVVDHARSRAMTRRSLPRHFDTIRIPLEDARAVARAQRVSINDVFVTAVADALGAYHDALGLPCTELRMAMAVSTRATRDNSDDLDDAANRFAPVRLLVPVSAANTAQHLAVVHEILEQARSEPFASVVEPLAALLLALPAPALLAAVRAQVATVDFATSNVRGTPQSGRLVGAHIDELYTFGPRMGAPLNVTMLSYAGSLELALNVDPAAVTDPAVLAACFHEAFGKLRRLG